MPSLTWKEPYVKKSISFTERQYAGAKRIAEMDGHGNVSRLMQDLLRAELTRRFGPRWHEEVEMVTNGHTAEVVPA